MVDPATASIGALAGMAKIVPDEINRIASIGAVTNVGLTIGVTAKECDLLLLFNLGDRSNRINGIKAKIAAQLSRPIEFEDVISMDGHGTTKLENLVEMKVIRKEGTKWIIDVHKMIDEVESLAAVVSVKSKFPEALLKKMITVHINKAAKRKEGKLIYYMEVAVDHAWKNVYGSISLRDIVFTINIENMTGLISENMPSDMGRQMRFATAALVANTMSGKERFRKIVEEYAGGPWSLLIAAGTRITHLTSQEIPVQMESLISIDPADEFEFLGAQALPLMATIASIPLPMYFPNVTRLSIRTRLEAGTLTRKGRVEVDLNELRKMVSQAVKEIRSMAKGIKQEDVQEFIRRVEEEAQKKSESTGKDGDLYFE